MERRGDCLETSVPGKKGACLLSLSTKKVRHHRDFVENVCKAVVDIPDGEESSEIVADKQTALNEGRKVCSCPKWMGSC